MPHWTERGSRDFIFSIASDFVDQIENKMEVEGISRTQLAKLLGLSKGRISQIINNPGNLTLDLVVRCARVLGLKVGLFAYDDNDPKNEHGTINGKVFNFCWESCGRPRTAWDMQKIASATSSTEQPIVITVVPNYGTQEILGDLVEWQSQPSLYTRTLNLREFLSNTKTLKAETGVFS